MQFNTKYPAVIWGGDYPLKTKNTLNFRSQLFYMKHTKVCANSQHQGKNLKIEKHNLDAMVSETHLITSMVDTNFFQRIDQQIKITFLVVEWVGYGVCGVGKLRLKLSRDVRDQFLLVETETETQCTQSQFLILRLRLLKLVSN